MYFRYFIKSMITVIMFAGGLSAAPAWDMSSLDSFAPAVMRKREMGGLQVCVSDKVRSECLAYGVRDTERKPVTPNTYFLGSGLMQPVTALTTGEVAAKSGKKLTDVVYKSRSTEIRLEQLLTQTSGFSVAKSSYLAGTKKPELLPQVEYTPGTEFLATPTNYFVMAKLTAEWSGQDFVKSAAAHVRSTGMDLIQNSEGLFLSHGGPLDDVAEGVAAPGSKVFQIQLPETAEPAWDGLWTTARGYSTYLRGLSNSRGKNLFKPLFQYDPSLGGSVPGFHLMKDRCGSSVLRVEGARGGFVSFAALFEDGRSIVILGNAPHPEVGRELYQFIRKFVWKESCINEETLTAVGEDLDGFYRPNHGLPEALAWLGFLQDIKIQKGEQGLELLGMFEGKSSVHWIALSPDIYFAIGSAAMDGWTIRILRDASGKPTGFVSDLGSYKKIPAILSVRAMPVLLAGALFIMLAALLLFLSLKKKRSQHV